MKVPVYDSIQVGADVLPQPRFSPALVRTGQMDRMAPVKAIQGSDSAAVDAQRAGQATQKISNHFLQLQAEAEKEVAQTRVDDAINQAKESALRLTYDKDAGYTMTRGRDALERPDGKSLIQEYEDRLTGELSVISENLGSDLQRQLFSEKTRDMMTSFRSGLMQHTSKQYDAYQLSIAEGAQKNALDDISKNYGNFDTVEKNVGIIKAEVYRQGKVLGMSAEAQEAKARELTSRAHKVAIAAAIEDGQIDLAAGYIGKYSKQMDGDDLLQMRSAVDKAYNNRLGLKVANDIFTQAQPEIEPSNTELAFNVLINAESGGKQFDKNGQPLQSTIMRGGKRVEGAIGIAQIMRDTGPEAAKLAGLQWDEERWKNDEQYNKALGLAYFQKQLQDNGGDLAKAYAAYNTGPGNLKSAVARAHKEGGNWIDYVPKETQAYVTNNLAAYQAGMGKPKQPTLEDMLGRVARDPRLTPEAQQVAMTAITKQYDAQQKAKKQKEESALNDAMEYLYTSGGDLGSVPVAIMQNIPGTDKGKVMDFAKKLSAGTKTETNPEVYYALNAMAANDPKAFSNTDLRKYLDVLSETDFKYFVKAQGDIQKPGEAEDVATATQQISAVIDSLKLKGSDKGVFLQQAHQALLSAQNQKGSKLNQKERQEVLDKLTIEGSTGWFGSTRLYKAQAEGKDEKFTPDFNDQQRAKASQALQRAGLKSPSRADIDAFLTNYYFKK